MFIASQKFVVCNIMNKWEKLKNMKEKNIWWLMINYMLDKELDKIKEKMDIIKFDDTNILIDTND